MLLAAYGLPDMTALLPTAAAQPGQQQRYVPVELYIQSRNPDHKPILDAAQKYLDSKRGARLRVHDLDSDSDGSISARVKSVCRAFRVTKPELPLIYGCNALYQDVSDPRDVTHRLDELFCIDVYVRSGCSRCARAKVFLTSLKKTYPAFEFRLHDIATDSTAIQELNKLVQRYRQSAASVPVFHICNQLVVGFDSDATTGSRITKILDYWTFPEPAKKLGEQTSMLPGSFHHGGLFRTAAAMAVAYPIVVQADESEAQQVGATTDEDEVPLLPVPEAGFVDAPLMELPPPLPDSGVVEQSEDITLPYIGRVAVSDWGMPLFTIIVGLVDGFNPCAMWVLLFLLSILVNLKDRWRILAVAGTFVLISGMAYFAFMATWLTVFNWIGYLRPIQVTLAVTAIVIGSVHIKDFFAFKKGVSLSIPDSAKPGISARVRKIVNAENLWGAIIGAAVLAVLVNIVELLCTAGLPAMYSQILTMQDYPGWKNYAHLLLYNLAYMFDDSLMVTCVVVTLGKRRLQEHQGRWLKLVSGMAIALLGLVMLFKPDWLV